MIPPSTTSIKQPVARNSQKKIWIVLPAYNEEGNLSPLLEKIDESMQDDGFQYEVVLVDDGSQDQTLQVASQYATQMPLRIERHMKNMGLGATIRDGLKLAAENCGDNDIVVAMDCDNTHTPGLIRSMVRLIREGNDVVIASRFQKGAQVRGVPFHRQILSIGMSVLYRTILPIRGVRDYSCGYRAYRGGILREAFKKYGDRFVSQNGFECMVDILLKLRKMDVIFTEVPLILRYDFKIGKSKMDVIQTISQTLSLLLRRRIEV